MSREFGAVRGARQIALAAVGQSVTIGEQTMVIPRECRRAKGRPIILYYFSSHLGLSVAVVSGIVVVAGLRP